MQAIAKADRGILKFLKSLRFIFMPHFWIMLGKYDKEYDLAINHIIDNPGDVIHFDTHIAAMRPRSSRDYYVMSVGIVKIWVVNYPYAYGTPYLDLSSRPHRVRPSRNTIARLRKFEKKEYELFQTRTRIHETFKTLYRLK